MPQEGKADMLCLGHIAWESDGVTFSSNFDNGNLLKVENGSKSYEYFIWSAPDNYGQTYVSRHNAWFYFTVSGVPKGNSLRLILHANSRHAGLFKFDMRPVCKSKSTGERWVRVKTPVQFQINENNTSLISFEYNVDNLDETISFAFTYPYTYTMLQNELQIITNKFPSDSQYSNFLLQDNTYSSNNYSHSNKGSSKSNSNSNNNIYFSRELLITSLDGRRIDLLTITSMTGMSHEREPVLPGLFPSHDVEPRPFQFPEKLVIFVSARVHPGEVPAQHTFKGLLDLLLDPDDLRAKELRKRYVFKLIPMLNPDGVFRGYMRMDTLGKNLNRFYQDPDPVQQPAIYAAKSLLDYYSATQKLGLYLDLHAHASKRGCFIYGNVMDNIDDQIQNQLFCKLIALNTPHFDYDGCLFSREHMVRIEPGDAELGLSAEGSGRVASYLNYHIIHSYTLECNYNMGRFSNEVPSMDSDCGGKGSVTVPVTAFSANPDKYTPASYATVGQACLVALLDIRGHNPCSRISKSRHKTLDRLRDIVLVEVKSRPEYRDQHPSAKRLSRRGSASSNSRMDSSWKRVVDEDQGTSTGVSSAGNGSGSMSSGQSTPKGLSRPELALQALKDQRLSRNRRLSLNGTSSQGVSTISGKSSTTPRYAAKKNGSSGIASGTGSGTRNGLEALAAGREHFSPWKLDTNEDHGRREVMPNPPKPVASPIVLKASGNNSQVSATASTTSRQAHGNALGRFANPYLILHPQQGSIPGVPNQATAGITDINDGGIVPNSDRRSPLWHSASHRPGPSVWSDIQSVEESSFSPRSHPRASSMEESSSQYSPGTRVSSSLEQPRRESKFSTSRVEKKRTAILRHRLYEGGGQEFEYDEEVGSNTDLLVMTNRMLQKAYLELDSDLLPEYSPKPIAQNKFNDYDTQESQIREREYSKSKDRASNSDKVRDSTTARKKSISKLTRIPINILDKDDDFETENVILEQDQCVNSTSSGSTSGPGSNDRESVLRSKPPKKSYITRALSK